MSKRTNSNALKLAAPSQAPATLDGRADLVAALAETLEHRHAGNTRRAYRSHQRAFVAWCALQGFELPVGPGILAAYMLFRAKPQDEANRPRALASQPGPVTKGDLGFEGWIGPEGAKTRGPSPEELAPMAYSSLKVAAAAIRDMHRTAGAKDPAEGSGDEETVFAETMRSLLNIEKDRTGGKRQTPKAALHADRLTMVLAAIAERAQGKPERALKAIRDRALILVGFAGALRRSEIVGLDVADVAFDGDEDGVTGLTLTLRRSKTDKAGSGQEAYIPSTGREEADPVRALRQWLRASGIESGPVFRGLFKGSKATEDAEAQQAVRKGRLSAAAVAKVVKSYAEAAGLDPADFAGHSLRRGFVTSAIKSGATIPEVQAVTRHKDRNVLIGYAEAEQAKESHPLRRMTLCL